MMNRPVKVRVEWAERKMARLPISTTYSTVAKFQEDTIAWPSDAWSVVLEFQPENARSRVFEATARFLVPNAPWDRLTTGCVFDLYEGTQKTATVTVV